MSDQPVAKPLPTHHKQRINAHTDIHALSGIRSHDASVRATEDSSRIRPRGHCDRQSYLWGYLIKQRAEKTYGEWIYCPTILNLDNR
jgi:hypothetical protein